jgi:hypothetical protein
MPQKEHNPAYQIITIYVKRTYKNKTKLPRISRTYWHWKGHSPSIFLARILYICMTALSVPVKSILNVLLPISNF